MARITIAVLTLLLLSACASSSIPRDNQPRTVSAECEDRGGVLVLRGTHYRCINKLQARQMGLGRFP